METTAKWAAKTTKTGKIVHVIDVYHGKPKPTTLWHMQMEAMMDLRKQGGDLNKMVDAYADKLKTVRTEIVKPALPEFDF